MSRIKLGTPGWIYAMVNESTPGLIKLGASTNDPLIRAKQLSASTSAPTPFVCAYSRAVNDVTHAEALAHVMLDAERVNEGREFFRVSLPRAMSIMDLIAGGEKARFDPPTPMAELFATFPDDDSPRELTPEERAKCREPETR